MLLLKDIRKDYTTGSEIVKALKGVSISFRKSEFVSILGQSGCGKTTLLNIIGGLDRYTSGDLVINGVSTKDYADKNWDTYRNHSIGFVFQSYNLITHQTVLANVELALTLSGVNKEERRARAIKALERVGLGDQLKKKPTQMSGGQMQRVAIARALVNDPDILLADEPTGALDSATSVQIMEILKEISKEKLVIMVTHNAELADEYSTRIIRLHDGLVTSDSNPYSEEELIYDEQKEQIEFVGNVKKDKTQMSFWTALSLSFNNLMTKKGRTILTAFAGSIGIIGIALILSLSTGVKMYINQVQEETLSSYPVIIQEETTDLSSMMNSFMENQQSGSEHQLDKIYPNSNSLELLNNLNKLGEVKNNLKDFRTFLIDHQTLHDDYIIAIQESYNLDLNIVNIDKDNQITQVNPSELMDLIMEAIFGASMSSTASPLSSMSSMMGGGMNDIFCEILPAKDGGYINDVIYNQYELVYGDWPNSYDEMVLIVNSNNEISDLALYALGIASQDDFKEALEKWKKGGSFEPISTPYEYEDILSTDYRIVLPTDFYINKDGKWESMLNNSMYIFDVQDKYHKSQAIKISGIIRPQDGVTSTALSGSIGYTSALTKWYINSINASSIVDEQLKNPTIDIFTGKEFANDINTNISKELKLEKINAFIDSLDANNKMKVLTAMFATPSEKEVLDTYNSINDNDLKNQMAEILLMLGSYASKDEAIAYIDSVGMDIAKSYFKDYMLPNIEKNLYAAKLSYLNGIPAENKEVVILNYINTADDDKVGFIYKTYVLSDSTYEDNLELLGVVDLEKPSTISLYAKDFHSKAEIEKLIKQIYNGSVSEENQISYTDYAGLMMNGISTIIDAISYVLIGFVSISLVVSSIMIGIITYISVLERTKEIGVLRAIGASKRDVSRVFTAETIIEGFASGLIGILFTVLICIPINLILYLISGIPGLKAELPFIAGIILIVISMLLTLIAGFFPSRLAAKKDPVEALRTE